MSNYPLHPNQSHPPTMCMEIPVEEYENLKKENAELKGENRRLKRALWLAREWRAWCEGQFWFVIESDKPRDIYHLSCTNRIHRTPNEWMTYWYKVEQLCKKEADK